MFKIVSRGHEMVWPKAFTVFGTKIGAGFIK
jgi:hypothetical protein